VILISEKTRKFSNRKNELVSPIRNYQGKMTYKMQPLWKQMLGAKKTRHETIPNLDGHQVVI
jgi:hypothetical protein